MFKRTRVDLRKVPNKDNIQIHEKDTPIREPHDKSPERRQSDVQVEKGIEPASKTSDSGVSNKTK